MGSIPSFLPALALCIAMLSSSIPASAEGDVLVLPLRSIGVSDTTLTVARGLLAGELESRSLRVIGLRSLEIVLPSGAEGCDELECARTIGRDLEAEMVIYGALSKLGEKIITRVHALRMEEAEPFYNELLPATSEEELDRVMLRMAEGIASGRPNSDEATVHSVIGEEVWNPRSRATRRALGVRAGFLFPSGDSYGEVDRLTNLRFLYKHETPDYLVETTTIAGITWAKGFDTVEWDIFDLFAAKIFGVADEGIYLGGGLGVHSLRLSGPPERQEMNGYEYYDEPHETATTLTLDLGAGVLGLRTYDFQVVLDLRYHYVFEKFGNLNNKGAHGLLLTFGTNR